MNELEKKFREDLQNELDAKFPNTDNVYQGVGSDLFKQAALWAFQWFSRQQQWVSVKERLPEDSKSRLCVVWSIGGKPLLLTCFHTNGNEIETYDYQEDEPFMLPEGWYEIEEQFNGDSDEHYFKREVTHWSNLPSVDQLLPEPPK